MAELVLARVDSRLVHGQVLVKWTKQTQANSICIVDDEVAQDAMLIGLFKMAMPKGTTLEVLTAEEVSGFLSAQKGRVLLIFKDIAHAQTAIQTGVPVKDLQVAAWGAGKGEYRCILRCFYPRQMRSACILCKKRVYMYIFGLAGTKAVFFGGCLAGALSLLLK